MHILSVQSFFVTSRTGQPHGDELGRMKPFANETSSWALSSANSCGAILYGRLDIGAVPGLRSTMNSTALSGGMPGSSSGKTSRKSRTTGISSRSGSGSTFKECTWVLELGEVYLIVWPDGWLVSLIWLYNQGQHSVLITNRYLR